MGHPRRLAVLALLTIGLGSSGCYGPNILECSITCGAAGACPSDTTCGTDGYCHVETGHLCIGGSIDASLPLIDSPPGTPDARNAIDAPLGQPDARVPDAIIGPVDARPLPDGPPADGGGECSLIGNGEPDNQCPGETVGPIAEGKTLTIKDRAIFPASDLDNYEVPLSFGASLCSPGSTQTYALLIKLGVPANTDLRIRRFADDRVCRAASDNAGTALCIPFAALCPGSTTQAPTFHFAVRANGGNPTVVCAPYDLEMVFCAAGSTCDHCKTL